MRKLALDDEVLLSVSEPARYIGGELNSVVKDKSKVQVRFAMCFPDVYEIGMSHLGIQILYDMFNRREDVWCERVYSPWTDLDAIMRKKNIPLFALESQDPIKDFDFLGITLQYEMCYTNILQILDLSGIPLHAEDRGEDCPIVIGGGPCSYNPGGSRRNSRNLRTRLLRCFLPGRRHDPGDGAQQSPCAGDGGTPAGDGHGSDLVSGEARGSLYPGNPGQGDPGSHARLHPRMPVLPGRDDLPAGPGAVSGRADAAGGCPAFLHGI